MKTSRILTFGLWVCFLGSTSLWGQQDISKPTTVKKTAALKVDKSNVKVQRHTVMSRFDEELASSEEERLKKRFDRIADTEKKLSILDTMDISQRRKKILLRDLKYAPYSKRLNKATLVDTQFEETSSNQQE